MLNHLKRIRILWIVIAVFGLAAALTGVLNPRIYDGLVASRYLPGTLSQDVTALAASLLLLVLALRLQENSRTLAIIGLGIQGFLFYAYGVYVIEQVYNPLYFLYMAIFALSFYSVLYGVANIKRDALPAGGMPKALRSVSAAFCLLIPAVFVPLWVLLLVPLVSTGQRIENTYSVFILDLCFIMPAFVLLAVMLLKNQRLGVLLTPAMFVLGFTLLFPVGMAEPVKLLYAMGVAVDFGSLLMYTGISLMFLVLAIVYLSKLKSVGKPKVDTVHNSREAI